MISRSGLGRRLLVAGVHTGVAWGVTSFSLMVLAPWTRVAALPALVTLFISFPMALVGLLYFYFGTYEEIPGVTWVIVAMLLGAGAMLLGATFFA